MVSELASKKCRPFMSFFWGQSTGEFNCRCKDLSLEHSCFIVNGTKGPLAGCLDVPRSTPYGVGSARQIRHSVRLASRIKSASSGIRQRLGFLAQEFSHLTLVC